jgi:hypothetical protein
MAVSENKTRRMTTIRKNLDELIVFDAEANGLSISEQIAAILEKHYESEIKNNSQAVKET